MTFIYRFLLLRTYSTYSGYSGYKLLEIEEFLSKNKTLETGINNRTLLVFQFKMDFTLNEV